MHRGALKRIALTAVVFAAAAASSPALAAPHDGNWSVVVVTEKGNCDKAYRYEVAVADGKISYRGRDAIRFDGSVAAGGAVKVAIRLGDQGAKDAGRLSGENGSGTWRGTGANGACTGRWEAERR